MALRMNQDEKSAVREAVELHYLAGDEDEVGLIAGYGVPANELSEAEQETRRCLLSAAAKLDRDIR